MDTFNENSLNISDTMDSSHCCPICLDAIDKTKNDWLVTVCGHEFHTSCLMKNASRNHFQCPCCRNVLVETPTLHETFAWSDDELPSLVEVSDNETDNESEYQIGNDESYVLDGMRWLFQQANGETVDMIEPFTEVFELWSQEMNRRHDNGIKILDEKVEKVMKELEKMRSISNHDIVFTLLQNIHGPFMYSSHALTKSHKVRRSIESIIRRFNI